MKSVYCLSLLFSALMTQASHAADGTWNVDANGTWDTANPNWLGDVIADDVGFTANFNTLDITADRTVSLDSARTIGNLSFGDVDVLTKGGWIVDNSGVAANILTLSAAAPTITVNALAPVDIYAPKSVVISAVIAGSNGLNKAGLGRLKLTGTNTYSGDTVVDGSVLAIINDRGLGAVPASFSATNIQLLNGASLDATATNDAYNAGNTVDIDAKRGIYLGPGVQSLIKNHRGITFHIRGIISGPGALAFREPTTGDDGGGSRTHVYGANTYTGDTTISHSGNKDPGVFLQNALALQNSTLDYNVTASDTTLLWFNSSIGAATGFTIGGLKGSKNLNLSPQGNTARNLKIGNNNQDTIYNGIISSTNDTLAGITKIGNGTLTLTKACTYTGPTVVAGGTLALSSTGSFASSSKLEINAGATLDTTARPTHALPGSPKTVVFHVDGTGAGSSGRILASGLDISSAVVTIAEDTPLNDSVYILATYNSLTGAAFASVTPPAGYIVDYAYNGGTQIALVPSTPSAYAVWAAAKGLTGLPGSATDPALGADPDKDGKINAYEFALNGDPLDGASLGGVYVFAADSDTDSPDTQPELIMTLSVRASANPVGGVFLTLVGDGVTYEIQGSSDLSFSGSAIEVSPITSGLPDISASAYQYRSFSLPSSNGLPSKGFLRAKVSMMP